MRLTKESADGHGSFSSYGRGRLVRNAAGSDVWQGRAPRGEDEPDFGGDQAREGAFTEA